MCFAAALYRKPPNAESFLQCGTVLKKTHYPLPSSVMQCSKKNPLYGKGQTNETCKLEKQAKTRCNVVVRMERHEMTGLLSFEFVEDWKMVLRHALQRREEEKRSEEKTGAQAANWKNDH